MTSFFLRATLVRRPAGLIGRLRRWLAGGPGRTGRPGRPRLDRLNDAARRDLGLPPGDPVIRRP